MLKYHVNQASAADFYVYAIVLYEEDIIVDKVGDNDNNNNTNDVFEVHVV